MSKTQLADKTTDARDEEVKVGDTVAYIHRTGRSAAQIVFGYVQKVYASGNIRVNDTVKSPNHFALVVDMDYYRDMESFYTSYR